MDNYYSITSCNNQPIFLTNPNNIGFHRQTQSESSLNDAILDGKWASRLLRDCVKAMTEKDSSKVQHLLWMLYELSSPYGDCDQKLAYYFLQVLFYRMNNTGNHYYKTLVSAAGKCHCFDAIRQLILKFQEASPWMSFGHVASNGAMLEALDHVQGNSSRPIHIIDISNTLCTQWPTLLEALATKTYDTPKLKLTVVVTNDLVMRAVMKEISPRMERFARLMGVPFEFKVMSALNCLGELTKDDLGVDGEAETVIVNCDGALRRVRVEERRDFIEMIRSLNPKIVTVVEQEADFVTTRNDFVRSFEECLRFYAVYFDMLEESFGPTSNEKLLLERECLKGMVRVLACDEDETNIDDDLRSDSERREKGYQWSVRFRELGFSPVRYSDDVVDDVKALLKRYKAGWSIYVRPRNDDRRDEYDHKGIFLTWKEEPVIWASVWKP